MQPKQTYFCNDWLDFSKFPDFAGWLKADQKNCTHFYCTVCERTIALSKNGIAAVKSHSYGIKHKDKLEVAKDLGSGLGTLHSYFGSTTAATSNGTVMVEQEIVLEGESSGTFLAMAHVKITWAFFGHR